jgi:DNA-binding LacI/PurR family transcriptional regulator
MADPSTKAATLYDVAKQAGVSYQTVSRVINGSPHVSPKTLLRVQEAIRDLDYQPNKAAQMLVTGRSHTIEVIMAGVGHFGPAQMMAGVERAARQLGYRVMFSDLDGALAEDVEVAIDNMAHVDGAVIITPIQNHLYDYLIAACQTHRYVQIGTRAGSKTPSVVIDQMYGSQMATQHLIDLGHRAIAEISGPLHWHDAAARHQGWLATLAENKLQPVHSVAGDWTAPDGYKAALELLDHNVGFTGLVVANDQMALGAMRALRERELRIPHDVSVVGFDDTPESAYFEPSLTTVRQDFLALGKQSVEYLIEQIKNPQTPIHQRVLYPTLIKRDSTQAPSSGR